MTQKEGTMIRPPGQLQREQQAKPMESTETQRADATTEAVLELILSGTFDVGGWLREAEIAKSLGVSRTPVRDALRELAGAGVVVIEQHRGARIKSYSPEKIEEVYRARALVESKVTAAAVPIIREAAVDELKHIANQMRAEHAKSGAVSALARLNREFHALIFMNSGDHPLASTAQSLLTPMVVSKVMHSYEDRKFRRSMDEHEDLIAAIERRDPEWAGAIMSAHILGGLSSFKKGIRNAGAQVRDD